jgi:TonB dependent receptor-like, beta-barrel/Carboxypeptidase regulatory-like domain/TonB-dependent Receptor Plug Domain
MRILNQCRTLGLGGLLALLLAAPATGQNEGGRIVGRVVDARTGEAVSGARVTLVGSNVGTESGLDGRYSLSAVSAAVHSIRVTFIGYAPKTVEGVNVPVAGSVELNVSMTRAAIQLSNITVEAEMERGSVGAALDQQRTAVGVVNSTTAEQIAKSPDSDAAQAVQRVSGVTVRDGKYVFVRGLGERYTTTSLNGARVPSPEPEKKEVPLDLFPSNLLESITTSKTFTPDQPGDFSGAQVNLKTRSFPADRILQLSVTGGWNASATGKTTPRPISTGREWLALAAGERQLSDDLTGTSDFTRLSRTDINSLIRSIPSDWTYVPGNAPPNLSVGLSFGGEDPILGHRFGYTGALTYSRAEEYRGNEDRARAVAGDILGTPKPYNPFSGSTSQTGVLWGGLFNMSTYLGRNTKIDFNNTYDRSATNLAHEDWGTLEEFQQVDSLRRTSLDYVERMIRSHQLRGEHQLGERNDVSWSFTASAVSRVEPDRSDIAYGYEFAPTGERLPLAWLGFIPEAAKRTTADLHENGLSGDLNYALSLGPLDRPTTIRIGGAHRHTKRDAFSASYNLRAVGLNSTQRAASPEALFYGVYTEADSAKIVLEPNSVGGTYTAEDNVSAGYLMAEVPLGSHVRAIGGARIERWKLQMGVQPTSRSMVEIDRENTDLLPSLALNISLSDNHTLRLSASQTLSRPEYRELAPVSYRDMLGEREVFGDSSLVRTLVQNFDLRWEWYPGFNEVISLAGFAKRFDNPIERIDVATSGVSQLSFINAASAFNYGVEMELRKGLGFLAEPLQPLAVLTNVTLMRSRINTSNSTLSALTNDKRPMVGQAPYVVNAGLSYTSYSSPVSLTALYNVVGRRITYAAVTPIKVDTYEEPRQQLDFSARFPLYRGVSAKVDATNLLDSAYEERQGDVIRFRYKTGRAFSLGITWDLW